MDNEPAIFVTQNKQNAYWVIEYNYYEGNELKTIKRVYGDYSKEEAMKRFEDEYLKPMNTSIDQTEYQFIP